MSVKRPDVPKSYQMSFSIPEPYVKQLDEIAETDRRTRSGLLCKIVTEYLDKVEV